MMNISLRFQTFLVISAIIGSSFFSSKAIAAEPIVPGTLIKGSGSAVYYYYGNRYAFPNENVYFSWYDDFTGVKTVSDEFLASIPLVGNVRLHPGKNMIKLTTDPKVYFIMEGNALRWVQTEADAVSIYGSAWATKVRDVSDGLFMDYRIEQPLPSPFTSGGTALFQEANVLAYPDISRVLKELIPDEKTPLIQFVRPPSVTNATYNGTYGYSATTSASVASLLEFFADQSTAWARQYDGVIPSPIATGTALNFTKVSDQRFAQRSVFLWESPLIAPNTEINFSEIQYPTGFIAYPRMSLTELRYGNHLLFENGQTTDSLAKISAWYRENALSHGWQLVREGRPAGSELGETNRIVFQKPGTHTWIVIEIVQMNPATYVEAQFIEQAR